MIRQLLLVVEVLSNSQNKKSTLFILRNDFWTSPIPWPRPYRNYFAFMAADGQQYALAMMPQGYAPVPFLRSGSFRCLWGQTSARSRASTIGDKFRMFQDDWAVASHQRKSSTCSSIPRAFLFAVQSSLGEILPVRLGSESSRDGIWLRR